MRIADTGPLTASDLAEASTRWQRFQRVLASLFGEVHGADGAQSALRPITLPSQYAGGLMVKCDHEIGTTGSIKGRGGGYEVLSFAGDVAMRHGLGSGDEAFLSDAARTIFAEYTIIVGSTGNLGFSVGVAGRKLGFEVEVHMSRDARPWKKERLRRAGVKVVEHDGDYSAAVAAARRSAAANNSNHFVDDENSITLLLGYSAAASELAGQLAASNVQVDETNPLLVYIPCGVGGTPGGISAGLKAIFGRHVHCIFVEPVASPCVLVQLASGTNEAVSVYDCNLPNNTIVDGLAVAQASLLVTGFLGNFIAGVATVTDADLSYWVERMWKGEAMRLEPSSAAGFAALANHGQAIMQSLGKKPGTSIIWTTGGSFLPDEEWLEARHAAGSTVVPAHRHPEG